MTIINRRRRPTPSKPPSFDWMVYLILGAIALVVVAGIAGCNIYLDQWKCGQKGTEMNRETKFTVAPRVCYIRLDDGSYIDIDKYRAIN